MFTSPAEDSTAFAEAMGAEADFERVADTADQVAGFDPPTAPDQGHRPAFGEATTQAEALPPDVLAGIVRGAIEAHRDPRIHQQALARETAERAAVRARLQGSEETARPAPGRGPGGSTTTGYRPDRGGGSAGPAHGKTTPGA